MFKKLLSTLLTVVTLSSSSVYASSYEPIKYPLSRTCSFSYRCLIKNSPLSNQGFPYFDTSHLDYFYHLVRSNKVTSKGYPYRACNFIIQLSAQVRIYSPRDKSKSENLGVFDNVHIHYQSNSNSSNSFSPLDYSIDNDTIFRGSFSYIPFFSSSDPPSVILADLKRLINEFVSRTTDDNYTIERFILSSAVLSSKRNYSKYGCDTVPIHVPSSNTCPNLIIRGLPFIRNTITCHQKNR